MSSLHQKYGNLHSRFLDINGDGTGSIDQAVDGSVTPVDFKVTCPMGATYELNRAIITLKDSGTFDTDAYGNGIALSNGFHILTSRPWRTPVEINYTAQHPIRTNGDWVGYLHDTSYVTFGQGDNILSARYTFTNDGAPIKLGPGDSFIFRVNDDLTALTEHHIRVGMTIYPASVGAQ